MINIERILLSIYLSMYRWELYSMIFILFSRFAVDELITTLAQNIFLFMAKIMELSHFYNSHFDLFLFSK